MSTRTIPDDLRDVDVTLEDFLWLIDNGEPIDMAARRVGTNVEAIQESLRRRGITRPAVTAECSRLHTARAAKRANHDGPLPRKSRKPVPGRCKGGCGPDGQGRVMWRYSDEHRPPGSVKHAGGGYCSTCRSRLDRRGELGNHR